LADANHDDVPRWLLRAFVALCVEVYGLLVFGAAVRVHEAGLSCPDWPLCFGEVIPEMDLQIFLEWGHRALAGTVSVVFLGLGVATARHPALRARAGRWFLAAGGVLALQIVLGGLTVLHLLAGWSVTLHLLCGNLFLALLVAGTLALRAGAATEAARADRSARRAMVALAAAFVLQLALGGLVSSHHAGTVCTEWPACQGGVWFPSWEGPLRLHLLHRLGAYVLFAGAWAAAYAGARRPAMRAPAFAFAGLVTVQALLGIGNVLWALPQTLAIGHAAMAGLLTLTLTWLGARVWRLEAAPPVEVAHAAGMPAPGNA
jgi:heme A synthase